MDDTIFLQAGVFGLAVLLAILFKVLFRNK